MIKNLAGIRRDLGQAGAPYSRRLAERIYAAQVRAGGTRPVVVNTRGLNLPPHVSREMLGLMGMGSLAAKTTAPEMTPEMQRTRMFYALIPLARRGEFYDIDRNLKIAEAVLKAGGRETAVRILRETLDCAQNRYPLEHSYQVRDQKVYLAQIAAALAKAGETDEAQRVVKEIEGKNPLSDHQNFNNECEDRVLISLAEAMYLLDESAEAFALCRQVVIFINMVQERPYDRHKRLAELVQMLVRAGKIELADEVATYFKRDVDTHGLVPTPSPLVDIASARVAAGEHVKALQVLEKAITVTRLACANLGKLGTACLLVRSAELMKKAGRPEAAPALLQDAEKNIQEMLQNSRDQYELRVRDKAFKLIEFAGVLAETGKAEKALEMLEAARPLVGSGISEKKKGERVHARALMAKVMFQAGKKEEAFALIQKFVTPGLADCHPSECAEILSVLAEIDPQIASSGRQQMVIDFEEQQRALEEQKRQAALAIEKRQKKEELKAQRLAAEQNGFVERGKALVEGLSRLGSAEIPSPTKPDADRSLALADLGEPDERLVQGLRANLSDSLLNRIREERNFDAQAMAKLLLLLKARQPVPLGLGPQAYLLTADVVGEAAILVDNGRGIFTLKPSKAKTLEALLRKLGITAEKS